MHCLQVLVSVVATVLVTFFSKNVSQNAADYFHHGWTAISYAPPPTPPPAQYIPNADDWADTYHRLRLFNGSTVPPPSSPLYTNIFRPIESPPVATPEDNAPRVMPTPEWQQTIWRVLCDVVVIILHQYFSLARISWERHAVKDEAAKVMLEFKWQLTGMALKLKAAYVEISRLREVELSSRKNLRQGYEEMLESKRIEMIMKYASEADHFRREERMRCKEEVTAITTALSKKHDDEMKRVREQLAETEAKVSNIRAIEYKLRISEEECRVLDAESREKSLAIIDKDASLKRKMDRRADAEKLCNQRIAEMRKKLEIEKISSGDADELRNKVHDLNLKIDALKKEKDEMEADHELEALQASENAWDVQEHEVNLAKAKVSSLEQEVLSLKEKVSVSEKKASMLEKDIDHGTELYTCLQQELRTAKEARKADLEEHKVSKKAQEAQIKKHQADNNKQAAEIKKLETHVNNFVMLIGNPAAFTDDVASNASSTQNHAALEVKVDPVFAASPATVLALKNAIESSTSGPLDMPSVAPEHGPEPSASDSTYVSAAIAPQVEPEPSKPEAVEFPAVTTKDEPKSSADKAVDHVTDVVHTDESKPFISPATKPSAAVTRRIEASSSRSQSIRSRTTNFNPNPLNLRAKRPFADVALDTVEKEVKEAPFDAIVQKHEDVQDEAADDAQASASKAVFHAEAQQVHDGQEDPAKIANEADESPEAQEMLDVPDMPEIAEMQEAPEAQEMPDMPDVPDVPEMQEAPAMPEAQPTVADILERLKLSMNVPPSAPAPVPQESNEHQGEAMEGLEIDAETSAEKSAGFEEDAAQYDWNELLQDIEDSGELLHFVMSDPIDLPELPPLDMSGQSSVFAEVPQSSLPEGQIQQLNPKKKSRLDSPAQVTAQEPDYQSILWEAANPSLTEPEHDLEMAQSLEAAQSENDLEMAQSPGAVESENDLEMAQSPEAAMLENDLEMAQSPEAAKSEDDLEMAQSQGAAESEHESGVSSAESSGGSDASSSEEWEDVIREPSPFSSRPALPVPSPSAVPTSAITGSYYASLTPSHTAFNGTSTPLIPGLRTQGTSYTSAGPSTSVPGNTSSPTTAPPYIPSYLRGPTSAPPYVPSYLRGLSTTAPHYNPAALPPPGTPYGPSTHPAPWSPVTQPSPEIRGSPYSPFSFSSPTSPQMCPPSPPPWQTTTPPRDSSWLGIPRMSPAEPAPPEEPVEKPKRFPPPGSRTTLKPHIPNPTKPPGQPSPSSSTSSSPLSSAPPSPPPPPPPPALVIHPVEARVIHPMRAPRKAKPGLFSNLKKSADDST